jgi:Xaa-Pro dipeptidase
MSMLTFESSDPASSGEIQTVNPERAVDIEHKHRVVGHFLKSHHYDAILLQKPSNFAWFTSGGDNSRGGSSEMTAALFVTPEARVLVCNNVDSGQLFDREVSGLGFQLKQRPWYEPSHVLIEDLCRGRNVASDTGFGNTDNATVHLQELRIPLTALECERIRDLGRKVAHAVEASARHCEPGQTEAEIAGALAHRLIRHEIQPERLFAWADSQGQRYRHWSYGLDRFQTHITIGAIGRWKGLCAGAARTVCFGKPSHTIYDAHLRANLMQATGMYFSQPDWELFETFSRVSRIYEKFGLPDEWQSADQGSVIAYNTTEVPIVPRSEFRLAQRMPVFWHPSVGPALVADTILVGESEFELLTPADDWPRVKVEVKGTPIFRPDILRRDAD